MHEDKYHVKNRGWIHKDISRVIGGIVYLSKDPEEDTGTSLYKNKQLTFPYGLEKILVNDDGILERMFLMKNMKSCFTPILLILKRHYV